MNGVHLADIVSTPSREFIRWHATQVVLFVKPFVNLGIEVPLNHFRSRERSGAAAGGVVADLTSPLVNAAQQVAMNRLEFGE